MENKLEKNKELEQKYPTPDQSTGNKAKQLQWAGRHSWKIERLMIKLVQNGDLTG